MHAMRRLCGIAAALMLATVPGVSMAQSNQPADAKSQFVMKLASATLNDGQHEWMRRFAAAIETKSGGRIKPELYPASQLGSNPRMIEGTQLGSIQMFLAPPEFFAGVDPRFELLSAAGTFLAAVAAVISVSSIVLDETANAGTALLISFGWFIGTTLQIAAGIVARTRKDTSTTS